MSIAIRAGAICRGSGRPRSPTKSCSSHAGDIVRAEAHGAGRRARLSRTSRSARPTASATNMARSAWSSCDTVLRLDRALGSVPRRSRPDRRQGPLRRRDQRRPWRGRPARGALHPPRLERRDRGAARPRSRRSRRPTRATTHRSRPAIIAELQKAPFIGEVYTAERLARAGARRLEGAADEALVPAGANPELPACGRNKPRRIPPGALRHLRPVQAGHDLRLCALPCMDRPMIMTAWCRSSSTARTCRIAC